MRKTPQYVKDRARRNRAARIAESALLDRPDSELHASDPNTRCEYPEIGGSSKSKASKLRDPIRTSPDQKG